MSCASCGFKTDAEARYCERCGLPIAGRHLRLVLEQGMTPGRQYLIAKDSVVIGRSDVDEGHIPDVDLYDQADGSVHRRHATLQREGDRLFLEDGANMNTAIVNNRIIGKGARIEVRSGDHIRLGNTVLLVK